MRIIALEPALDTHLRQHVHEDTLAVGPEPLSRLIDRVKAAVADSERMHLPLAILVDQRLRRPLKKLLTRPSPDLAIIAYQELPVDLNIETVAVVSKQEVIGDADAGQLGDADSESGTASMEAA